VNLIGVISKVVNILMLVATVTAAVAFMTAERASAFNPQPDPPAFGVFGITHGQTARLNLVGVEDPNLVSLGLCRQVELMFVDAESNTLAHQTETLLPGHAVALELNGDLFTREAGRMEIRGIIRGARGCSADSSKFKLVASLEVFNNDGARTVFMVPSDR